MVSDKRKKYCQNYFQEHKDHLRNLKREYRQEHLKRTRKESRRYRHTLTGKSSRKKEDAKRRSLGFFPLNDWFEDSEGHHVDKLYVIYIPKVMHKSVWHNVWTNQGMCEINVMAFDYLLSG